MYSLREVGVGALGEILTSSAVLKAGERYTFTFDINKLLITASDIMIQTQLQYFMQNYGSISSVVRPLFSGRFVVVVVPKKDYFLSDWLSAFSYSWKNIPGFTGTTFLSAEGGTSATAPGGLPGLLKGAGEQIQVTLPEFPNLKSYLIWGGLLIVGVAVVIPMLTSQRGVRYVG